MKEQRKTNKQTFEEEETLLLDEILVKESQNDIPSNFDDTNGWDFADRP